MPVESLEPVAVIPELPSSGGSYRINPDGTLTAVQQPQTPASAAATYPAAKE